MPKPSRSLEEIVDLQDKAISALTQANLALQLALEAIQAARREVGTPLQFPFAQPNPLNAPFGGLTIGGSNKGVWNNGGAVTNGYSDADLKNAVMSLTTTGKTLSGSAEAYQSWLADWKSDYEKLSEEPATESNSVALKGCVQ
jgi:hypothetical protein